MLASGSTAVLAGKAHRQRTYLERDPVDQQPRRSDHQQSVDWPVGEHHHQPRSELATDRFDQGRGQTEQQAARRLGPDLAATSRKAATMTSATTAAAAAGPSAGAPPPAGLAASTKKTPESPPQPQPTELAGSDANTVQAVPRNEGGTAARSPAGAAPRSVPPWSTHRHVTRSRRRRQHQTSRPHRPQQHPANALPARRAPPPPADLGRLPGGPVLRGGRHREHRRPHRLRPTARLSGPAGLLSCR